MDRQYGVWVDHVAIRALVRGALDLPAGERLLLINGLVPSLVDDIGEAAVERFLVEVRIEAQRYAEAAASILTSAAAPHEYRVGTWGPAEADRLIHRSDGWHTPLPSPPRRSP